MIADALLSRLDGVKRTGVDCWLAKCPAHDDNKASLTVREIDNDKVLVHCFAGCAIDGVLGAVGLDMSDLFPARPTHRAKGERRPFSGADVLRAVVSEALIVAVAASTMGNGGELTAEDRARLLLASSRLRAAAAESGHE